MAQHQQLDHVNGVSHECEICVEDLTPTQKVLKKDLDPSLENDQFDAVDRVVEMMLELQETLIKLIIQKNHCDVRKTHEEPVGVDANYIFHSNDIWEKDRVMSIMNG